MLQKVTFYRQEEGKHPEDAQPNSRRLYIYVINFKILFIDKVTLIESNKRTSYEIYQTAFQY